MRTSPLRTSLAGLGSAVALVACGGSTAQVVVPKDPTPLAKCDVAKSNARPLVTEWPASEKANLETLLASQAVAVSYSGCEMQLLDACRIPGGYGFQRTSISNDTIEITSADELYAKIPLGAVGLEGELSSSGRLAINTTVVGQLRLDRDVAIPDTAACRDATHVISAISIGAFEMKSGGAVSGSAGVDVGNIGAGVATKSEETSLKSSGDRRACRDTEDEPNPDCRSPLQVFLRKAKVGGAAVAGVGPIQPGIDEPGIDEPGVDPNGEPGIEEPPSRPPPRPRPPPPTPKPKKRKPWDQPPADESVTVLFEAPGGEDGDKWKVLSREGDILCDSLPCRRRVGNQAGIQLQLDAAKKEDIRVFPVPADLGYSPGRTVRAVPDMGGGGWIWPTILTAGGAAAGGVGLVLLLTGDDTAAEESSTRQIAGIVLASSGGIALFYGLYGFLSLGSPPTEGELDISLVENESADVRLRLLPDGVSLIF
ncbi:MAG: hypothetical protein AAGN82_23450 [Myxococcota bacterium]